MNLQDFINTKIKKGVSEYDYFEIEKTNPTEYEKSRPPAKPEAC